MDMFLVMVISAALFMLPVFKSNMNAYMEFIEENKVLTIYTEGGSSDITLEEANHLSY